LSQGLITSWIAADAVPESGRSKGSTAAMVKFACIVAAALPVLAAAQSCSVQDSDKTVSTTLAF